MANLNTKTRYINMVIRKNNINISDYNDIILSWCNSNCENYAYIYHKNDINRDGIKEHEHIHLVLTMKKVQRLSTILYSLTDALTINTIGVEIAKMDSLEGSIQYLIHKNDKDKTQHDQGEIIHNYPLGELETILSSDNDGVDFDRLYTLVKQSKTNADIIKALGLGRYMYYRNVIKDLIDDKRNTVIIKPDTL